MGDRDKTIAVLRNEIGALKNENSALRIERDKLVKELTFLRTFPSILQGLKGEELVCKLSHGLSTKYAEKYDVILSNEVKIEVKYSKLHIPVSTHSTKRWTWSKPLGSFDKGKDYDLLILIGERDDRFEDQYLDDSPYVFFLIPYKNVESLMVKGRTVGGVINLSTNLAGARTSIAAKMKGFMVSIHHLSELLEESAVSDC